MFHTISEQKKLFLGLVLGLLLFSLGTYTLFLIRQFALPNESLGVFSPFLNLELANNPNEFLRIVHQNQIPILLRLLDSSFMILFLTCTYSLLIFDFFNISEFTKLKKIIFYSLVLSFIILSVFEYSFWFYFATSHKQVMVFQFKTFTNLVLFKWLALFLTFGFLGFVIWLEGKFYFIKLVGFFYISAFLIYLFHFKFTQLLDLGLILISLGLVGNWIYFAIRTLQIKGTKYG